MKITREVKTAILVLSGIALFIFGINYLKGKNVFTSNNSFHTKFDYNALSMSSPVTIKGIKVGKIIEISYELATGKTNVEFTVDKEIPFSKNSIMRLYEMGLMEGTALAIIPANDTEFATPGTVLQSEVEEGLVKSLTTNFSGISENLDGTLKNADSLMINLNHLVSDTSNEGLKNTIAELNKTIKSFRTLSNNASALVTQNEANLQSVLTNFNKASQDVAVMASNLKTVDFSSTVEKLDATLQNVNTLIANLEKGEGTLGKLLKDDKLYNNLEKASKEMEELLRDVKLHPKRYTRILSKKEIPYKEEAQ